MYHTRINNFNQKKTTNCRRIFENVGIAISIWAEVYLVIGTGNACAWQNNAMVEVLGNLKELLNAADGNDGAFDPIGSRGDEDD